MSKPGKEDSISAGYNIKEKTFLEYMEEAGLNGVFINMPLSHPPRTDFVTVGSIFSNIKVFPREMENEYDFSGYRLFRERQLSPEANARGSIEQLKGNMSLVKSMFKREKWDIFFYLFSQTDWVLHDCGADFFDDRDTPKARALYDVFAEVDKQIGWFLKNRGNANVIFLSDHGFEYHSRQLLYPVMLSRYSMLGKVGIAPIFPLSGSWKKKDSFKYNALNLMARAALHIPPLYHWLERTHPYLTEINLVLKDVSESKLIVGSANLALYVNDSRFHGPVQDDERDGVIEKTIRILKGYERFMSVLKGQEVYWGQQISDAPDLLLMPKAAYPRNTLGSDYLVEREISPHAIDGIFMAYGEDIANAEVPSSLLDIAPTVLHYFGLPVPEDMDGKVLKDIYKDDTEYSKRDVEVKDVSNQKELAKHIRGISLPKPKSKNA
jgi:predicted AlkP superfamily phosphohydrolase/phosphomutase